jgi:predicted histidine transporter YuiF (NhaC family)
MNDLIKITLATGAIVYGMTAPLPANEAVKETQDAINKWYETASTSISQDVTALGVTVSNIPEKISLGVSNFVDETVAYQKETWAETLKFEQEKQNWATIKGWFTPATEGEKK